MTLPFVAYIGLLALVAATPVLLLFDNLVVSSAIEYCAAIGVIIIVLGLRPGEARHFFKIIRLPAALCALTLAWIFVQTLPIPIPGLSRSIWDSAASALDSRLLPNISIDPALTLIALCRFAAIAGIGFIAAAASIERTQAEKVLWALAAAAAAISLISLVDHIGGLHLLNEAVASEVPAAFITAGVIGIVLFAACVIMIVERYEIRGHRHEFVAKLVIPIGIAVAGLLICLLPEITGGAGYAAFAAACGVTTIVIIYFVRRIGFGPRAGLAMGCVALFAVAVIIWTKGEPATGDVALRYLDSANANIIALDNRLLGEVGLGGSGAGTAEALSTLYGAQEPTNMFRSSTLAAQIGVELGRPALWILVVLAGMIAFTCARASFHRGRDFFYPLAGAGVGVAMILNAFSNAGLANLATSILLAVTLGLSFAQSVSRSL
jgi:hypothetical protein